MTDRRVSTDDPTSAQNLGLEIDPGATDLGDDVYRTTTNGSGALERAPAPQTEADLDAGAADLGDDVERGASEAGS